MNIKKHFKKLILILVLLLLFNFCYPKSVKAWNPGGDILAAPAKILYMLEEGILKFINDIFVNKANRAESSTVIQADGSSQKQLHIFMTPETIIKGKFILLDANIFKDVNEYGSQYYDYDANDGEEENKTVVYGKTQLRKTISNWYLGLRNFAIVALMSVLVYVGIRMIISSVSQDKAKYKAMFKDWLVALCLVALMHYIMIGILNLSSDITKALGGGYNSDMISNLVADINHILYDNEQYTYTEKNMDLGDAYALILVLFGVIGYTIIFLIKYLKREFTIFFLILLGPVSCITYPIDKIGDGKAQAFNRWFSEFLYQVIIQPFHLLMYIVLVGTAAELADKNVIYAIVCFAVMIPAEKFIKEMFGFKDRLGSPLGAMATGALASQLLRGFKSGGSSSSSNSNKEKNVEDTSIPTPKQRVNLPGADENSTVNRQHRPIREENGNSSEGTRRTTNYSPEEEGLNSGQYNSTSRESDLALDGTSEQERLQQEKPRDAMLDAYYDSEDYDSAEAAAWEMENAREREREEQKRREQELDDARVEEELRQDNFSDEEIADILGKDVSELNGPQENEEELTNPDDFTYDNTSDSETTDNIRPTNAGDTENIDNGDGQARNPQINQPQQPQTNRPQVEKSPEEKAWNAMKGKLADKRLQKYGNTKFLGGARQFAARTGRKAWNTGGKVRKKAIKGVLTAGLGALFYAGGAMFGKGKEAAALGGIVGNKLSNKINDGADHLAGKIDEYAITAYDGAVDNGKRKEKIDFMSNANNIKLAKQNFKDRNGTGPNSAQLERELEQMYNMDRHGIKSNQYNDVLKYQDKFQNEYGLDEQDALNTSMYAALQSQDYGVKDFRDPKKMEQAAQSIFGEYENATINGEQATEEQANFRTKLILNAAAGMKGVNNPELPARDLTFNMSREVHSPNIARELGIETEADFGTAELRRMNRATLKLEELNYSPDEITRIAVSSRNKGPDTASVLEDYEAKVEFISKGRAGVKKYISETKGIKQQDVSMDDIKIQEQNRVVAYDLGAKPEKMDDTMNIENDYENSSTSTWKTDGK